MTHKERQEAERQISLATKSVKPEHLEHYLCLAAARGKGTNKQTY